MNDEEDIMKKLQKVANRDCNFCWQKGENCDGDECEKVIVEKILNIYNRQKAEIERLKDLLKYEEAKYDSCAKQFYKAGVKEFAERLESKYTKVVSCNAGYVYRTIKEVEKEMVGGEDA